MGTSSQVAALLVAAALGGCAGQDGDDDRTAAPPVLVEHVKPPAARDVRLREECGRWEPSTAILDEASQLGDPATKPATVAALDAGTPAHRIDVLRAGLRLRDDAAARACAARLKWQQIDRWECARCVDLLVGDVLLPGSEADFEEFRSYLGSVELRRFLRSLPPRPWKVAPEEVIGQLHRIAMGSHLPDFVELTRSADPEIADAAWGNVSLLGHWNDEFREIVARREVDVAGGSVQDVPDGAQSGLPPVLAAWLRRKYVDPGPEVVNANSYLMWNEKIRWCWECTPGPRDAELLMALTEHGVANWNEAAGVAYALLGKLSDRETDAFLRRKAAEGEREAMWALARRGDAAMIEEVVADFREIDAFAFALLMEIDPERARRLFEEMLLGPDDRVANQTLGELADFVVPGAFTEPSGYDWRRTSFDGFDRIALAAKIPALRLAWIGAVVPGCRTRAVAEAAARNLKGGDLVPNEDLWLFASSFPQVAAFLETAAPAEFADALRRIRTAGGSDAELASQWLVALGDADAATAAATGPTPPFGFDYQLLARSKAPAVRTLVTEKVQELLESGERDRNGAVAALAELHGLPEAAGTVLWLDDKPLPRATIESALAGRPLDAVAALLVALPDEPHGDIGACDDPRVRAYLVRLQRRRELGHYWYATGQLAVLGEPQARTEFWGAMEDGRYRIVNESNEFTRTLGWNLAATLPFWIEQLRSQCCRIVTGGGDLAERVLDLENGCFSSPWRTAHRRAKESWDAAAGRFVESRILQHFVPAPR